MNKSLLLFFVLGITFVATAQNKATKKDTQGLINTILKRVVTQNACVVDRTVSEQFFINNFTAYHYKESCKNKNCFVSTTDISNIQWRNYLKCEMKTTANPNSTVCATLYFTTAMKQTRLIENKEISNYETTFDIVIQPGKFESIKKAFECLAEIAKEENKDPFKN